MGQPRNRCPQRSLQAACAALGTRHPARAALGSRPGRRRRRPHHRRQGKRTRLRRIVCTKTLPTIQGSSLRTSNRRDSSSRMVCQLLCQPLPLSNRLALRESASSAQGMKSCRMANRLCLMPHPSRGTSPSAFPRRLAILPGDGKSAPLAALLRGLRRRRRRRLLHMTLQLAENVQGKAAPLAGRFQGKAAPLAAICCRRRRLQRVGKQGKVARDVRRPALRSFQLL